MRLTLHIILLLTLLRAGAADNEKHLSVFSNAATYTLPVITRDGHDYIGLVELLDPLGTVNAQPDGRQWKLRYNRVAVDFTPGSAKARLEGHEYELPAKFLLENGRGFVPLACLGTLLPRVLGGPVTFHEASRRVLIGSVAVHFTAQVAHHDPPTLLMNFTEPVNPMISTEPGKLLMTFTRDPVVAPGTEVLTFDSKVIPSAHYEENNGTARITVSSDAPLFASFSNNGHTISISSAPQPVAQAPATSATQVPPPPAQPATSQPANPAASVATPQAPAAQPRFFAVVDAAHGGGERGAALTDELAEKDVTLAFARSLRQQLESQGFPTLLLRDGDNPLTLDQRAMMTNRARPAIYISLHAGPLGSGVRIYTALIPAGGRDNGPFRDWNTAQAAYLPISRALSSGVAEELQKQHVMVRTLTAPLRPLNNVATAAIAIEIAPAVNGSADYNTNAYRQQLATGVSAAVLTLRPQLEAGR